MKKIFALFCIMAVILTSAGCVSAPVVLDQMETVELLSFYAPSTWIKTSIDDGLAFSPYANNDNYFSVRCMDALTSSSILGEDIMIESQLNGFLGAYGNDADSVSKNDITDVVIAGQTGKKLEFRGVWSGSAVELVIYTFIYGDGHYAITFSSPLRLSRQISSCEQQLIDTIELADIPEPESNTGGSYSAANYPGWKAYLDNAIGSSRYIIVNAQVQMIEVLSITPLFITESEEFFDLSHTIATAMVDYEANGVERIGAISMVNLRGFYSVSILQNNSNSSGFVTQLNFIREEDAEVRAAYNAVFRSTDYS